MVWIPNNIHPIAINSNISVPGRFSFQTTTCHDKPHTLSGSVIVNLAPTTSVWPTARQCRRTNSIFFAFCIACLSSSSLASTLHLRKVQSSAKTLCKLNCCCSPHAIWLFDNRAQRIVYLTHTHTDCVRIQTLSGVAVALFIGHHCICAMNTTIWIFGYRVCRTNLRYTILWIESGCRYIRWCSLSGYLWRACCVCYYLYCIVIKSQVKYLGQTFQWTSLSVTNFEPLQCDHRHRICHCQSYVISPTQSVRKPMEWNLEFCIWLNQMPKFCCLNKDFLLSHSQTNANI